MAKKPANSNPIFDDVNLTLSTGGVFSYSLVATDPNPNDMLKYYFYVDGKAAKEYTAADGTVFNIDVKTGNIFSSHLIDFFSGRTFDLPILVEDNYKGQDTGTVRILYDLHVTEYSIDFGDPFTSAPAPVDASTDAFRFTDDVDANTHVVISGFSSDDVIEVSGVASVKALSFSPGAGPGGADDLVIVYNRYPGGVNITILEDVLVNPGFVYDHDSAVAAVGYDFLALDPSLIVFSIDIGNPFTSPPVVSVDANSGTFRFTDDVDVNTHVSIAGFSSDDVIAVSGVALLADLSFTRGFGPGLFDDLTIVYNNPSAGAANITILENVLHTAGGVFDYASAVAAVGYDFMVIG